MTKEQIEQIMNSDDHAKFENFNDLAQTALDALQKVEELEKQGIEADNEAIESACDLAYEQGRADGYKEGFEDGKNV